MLHHAHFDVALDLGKAGDDDRAGGEEQEPTKKMGTAAARSIGITRHSTHLLCRPGEAGTDWVSIVKKIVDERFDHGDCVGHGGLDGLTQAHRAVVGIEERRFAADEKKATGASVE